MTRRPAQIDLFTKRASAQAIPEPSEDHVHKTVLGTLQRLALPDVLYFHVPNGFWAPGATREQMARAWQRMERLGALPGASDLIIMHRGETLALEFKRRRGTASEDQEAFADRVARAGGTWELRDSVNGAHRLLLDRGLLRPCTGLV